MLEIKTASLQTLVKICSKRFSTSDNTKETFTTTMAQTAHNNESKEGNHQRLTAMEGMKGN